MNINTFLKPFGLLYKDRVLYKTTIKQRAFSGASTGDLYYRWNPSNLSADSELANSLQMLRARSRELERNNVHAKKFIRLVKTNVIGKIGIRPQSQVLTAGNNSDDDARSKIETAWKNWCKIGNCDVTGKYSFVDVQKLVMSSLVRDGEVLIRKISGKVNDFNFGLQLIESDHLDENHNDTLNNGNKIKMGVEYNSWGKPVAYWILQNHPGDARFGIYSYSEKIRIPADEIIHVFLPARISQGRGLPWMHAVMTDMNMNGGYKEAELVAARVGAAQGGYFTREGGDEYQGDEEDEGQPIEDIEPGEKRILPAGYNFVQYSPNHPTTAFDAFVKAIVRDIASGLDISYHSLSGDLTSVNYSSIRAGVIDERDFWREVQTFVVEHFLQPVWDSWLKMALLTKQVNLPFKIEKFSPVVWQTRGWDWVDPEKDMAAAKEGVKAGFTTATDIVAARGGDLEENYRKLKEEQALREKYKVNADYAIEEGKTGGSNG